MATKRSRRIKKLVRTVKRRPAQPSSRLARWTSTHRLAGGVVALFAAAIAVGVYQGLSGARIQRTAASRIARVEVPAADTAPLTAQQGETLAHAQESQPSAVDQAGDHVSAGVTIAGCLE